MSACKCKIMGAADIEAFLILGEEVGALLVVLFSAPKVFWAM
jgi:hypothetical protein